MHIVIDARSINSGTGTYMRELLNHLQNVDTSTCYTVLVPTKDLEYWQPTNGNFTLKAADFANYSLAEQTKFKTFLESLQPDLVHFTMPQQPVFYKGKRVTTFMDMTLLRIGHGDKNPLVFRAKQLIGRWVWKRVAAVSDHIITISNNTRREYREFTPIPAEKITTIHLAAEVRLGEITPYAALPGQQFIMYVGQQADYKNIRRLGEAHQQLLAHFPDLWLVLVGRVNSEVRANQEFFAAKGYKNIHFTDFIPDSQRDWLYTKAQAYVFPSLMEGFGLPPLEAMAYGTPVVSSNTSCMPEILGEAPVYFDPLSTTDMAAAIDKVLSDKKLQKNMVTAGKKQAAKYSWQRTAEETLAIYKKVLEQ